MPAYYAMGYLSGVLFSVTTIGEHPHAKTPNAQAEARATPEKPTPANRCPLWPVASSAVLGGWGLTRVPWPPGDRPPPPTLAPPWPQQAATPGGPWERAAATATDTGGEGLAPPCPGPARLAVPQPRQPDTAAHPYAGP